ncbi:MAG: glycerol-3-phosphate transporter, partial [Burkholderiaceae bacterium]|nr:glycerol-3-phosphate transporter [Burkholderiaceae bacterium]
MVERRPALTLITHLLLLLGVMVVAFPVYLAWVASTHTASTIAQSMPLPLWPGAHGLDNYALALLGGVGESGSRYPATLPMLGVSLASALIIALGKIAISLLSAFAIVYFRFPL